MTFNSFLYIILFLPITAAGFFLLGKRSVKAAEAWLVAASLVFYGAAGYKYVLLILCSIAGTLLILFLMKRTRLKKICLSLGIVFHLALLIFIKYSRLLVSLWNSLTGRDNPLPTLLLSLGISFFTFKQIAYLVDSYRGETEEDSLLEYLLYITFFPQLLQGPIALRKETIAQFRDSSRYIPNSENIADGVMMFAIGLFKKVMVADIFGSAVTWGFGHLGSLTSMDTWIIMIAYTFEIYFDFSGYCDMAAGSAKILGFDNPINFNSPYKSLSISEFWKRWHITLTGFFRKYVYIPLGGNRKGTFHTYLNILIIFLLSGIWHGANLTFLLWGLLHGILCVLHRMTSRKWDRLSEVTRWFSTFLVVGILWLLFRAGSVGTWMSMLFRMIRFEDLSLNQEILNFFNTKLLLFIVQILHLDFLRRKINGFGFLIYLAGSFFVCLEGKNIHELKFRKNAATAIFTALVLVACMLYFGEVSEYIYFNF